MGPNKYKRPKSPEGRMESFMDAKQNPPIPQLRLGQLGTSTETKTWPPRQIQKRIRREAWQRCTRPSSVSNGRLEEGYGAKDSLSILTARKKSLLRRTHGRLHSTSPLQGKFGGRTMNVQFHTRSSKRSRHHHTTSIWKYIQ